jgi:hypothetical protein
MILGKYVDLDLATISVSVIAKQHVSGIVENGVSFTFGHCGPYIVFIIVFLGLTKANLVHVGS